MQSLSFHLMGLQYLIDRPELSRDRGKVFVEIADGTITIEKIESCIQWLRLIILWKTIWKAETYFGFYQMGGW